MPSNIGKKRSRSNNVAISKKKKTSVNPFEIRVNRKKHEVIGQKSKSDAGGRPGLSRSIAIEKRKKTLLKEYKERHKSNSFIDRRFGEYDEEMSVEDKMLQRFAFQKKHRLDKSAVYNLESEELTHHGKSIYDLDSDEEVTTGVGVDSEEDDTEEHFAGFLTKVSGHNSHNEHPKSKKEAMVEVVANSKIQKFQKQEDQILVENLVSKVDSDWKDIQLMVQSTKKSQPEKSKAGSYDLVFQKLLHERKLKESQASLEEATENDKTDEPITEEQSSSSRSMQNLTQNLTKKEMDRAIVVFQARLKSEYKLFVKTKTWSHTQVTFFKMIRVMFSASAEEESIIHATMLLLGKMLETKCPVDNCYDSVLGLLTCAEFIEFVTPSNQFAPEVVNFLCAVLSTSLLSVQESPGFYDKIKETEDLCKAYMEAEKKFNDEVGVSPCALCCVLEKINSTSSVTKSSLRIVLLKGCISLLTKVVTLHHRLSSFAEIFMPLSRIIESCDERKIPKDVKEQFRTLKSLIADYSKQCKKVLTMLKQNPKSIKFYEPKFDETYEVGKRKVRNKKDGESSKLKYKVKKETKGAIRELRKDNAFLARQQLSEQLERDADRKKRVQELFSLLQTEQAEAKRERKKK